MCKKIISFVNKKGGSGKTSSLTNFAYCLAKRGYKVLAIDFDSQCNTGFNLVGKDYEKQEYTIIELINLIDRNISLPEKSKYILNGNDGIDLIPCNYNFTTIERLADRSGGVFLLKKFLDDTKLKDDYDFILIDNSPYDGKAFEMAVLAADDLIIPLTPAVFDLQGVMSIINKICEIANNPYYNIQNINIAGLLVTQYNPRELLSQKADKFCEMITDVYTFKNKIPSSVLVKQAQDIGTVVCKTDPNNKASIAYNNFTDEYLNLVKGA